MTDVSEFLARLSGVKSTGSDRWIARCPAHEDRDPSLAVRQVSDGRILAHCFAGCDIHAICGAVGLAVSDLFPEPLTREKVPPIRAPFSAIEALMCLRRESAVVALAASDLALGKPVTEVDRLVLAAERIADAVEAVHGR